MQRTILMAAVVLASAWGASIYFSPYSQCVRGLEADFTTVDANLYCAKLLGRAAQ